MYCLESMDLHTPMSFNVSSSQYLVCTRTKHTGKDEATPVLGFGLLQHPCPVLIGLLHTGIVVDLSVVDLDYLPHPDPLQFATSPSKKVILLKINLIFLFYVNNTHLLFQITREPFDNYIKNLLKHDSTSQPITKLGIKSKLTGREGFQVQKRIRFYFFLMTLTIVIFFFPV